VEVGYLPTRFANPFSGGAVNETAFAMSLASLLPLALEEDSMDLRDGCGVLQCTP
jgi:hypothetical protein